MISLHSSRVHSAKSTVQRGWVSGWCLSGWAVWEVRWSNRDDKTARRRRNGPVVVLVTLPALLRVP